MTSHPTRTKPFSMRPKRKLAIWTIRVVVYSLFVLGGTSVCLAILAFLGVLTIRIALEIPLGFAPGVQLLALAALFFVLGLVAHTLAARRLARDRSKPDHSTSP